jgi:hypothetical protein
MASMLCLLGRAGLVSHSGRLTSTGGLARPRSSARLQGQAFAKIASPGGEEAAAERRHGGGQRDFAHHLRPSAYAACLPLTSSDRLSVKGWQDEFFEGGIRHPIPAGYDLASFRRHAEARRKSAFVRGRSSAIASVPRVAGPQRPRSTPALQRCRGQCWRPVWRKR